MYRTALFACCMFGLAAAAGGIPLETTGLERMRTGWGTPRAGRSIDGNALKLGGKTFVRGVGTHAPSTHRVAARGNALSFSAMVGVDDETLGKGSVVFRVVADGKVVAEVPAKGGEGAKRISADLAGADTVVLEVADALDGNYHDHADWCDAVFEFKEGTRPLASAEMTRQLGILTPKGNGAPHINAPARYGARPGSPIVFKVPVTGEKPVEIAVSNLPEGMSFDPASRVISGAVATPGEYTLALTASNAKGRAARKMTLVIGDKLALTPPMGWNSWNAFAGSVSAEKIRSAVDAMVRLGLDEHGYAYVNIDDFWQKNPKNAESDPTLAGSERNADGTISPNGRFPDMKALADYIHSRGLKAGLYSSPGPYTCGGCTGSWRHELQDATSYAQWGYDYLKYDWCSYGQVATGEGHDKFQRPYMLMGRFLRMQQRDIVFSLCQYGWDDVPSWGAFSGGQCWRTTGDIFDTWQSVYGGIRAQAAHWRHSAPGAWNDADMLVLGRNVWAGGDAPGDAAESRLTPNEQYTHMSMWCMFASPLMIGCDLDAIDEFTLSLLTNDEVLAIDQDELGAAAALVLDDAQAATEIWARPLADGAIAFALLNADDGEKTLEIPFRKLGMRGVWAVRDLWRQKDEGVFEECYRASVPGHATHLVKLSPRKGAGLKPCLKDIRDNAWRLAFDDARAGRSDAGTPCADCP